MYKQALVGLLVGLTLGPLVGWLAGTIATFVAVSISDSFYNGSIQQTRMSMLGGGLIGIPLAAITGPLVGLPLRIVSSTMTEPITNTKIGGVAGGSIGLGAGLLVHLFWNPSPESLIYLIIHSTSVGICVGMLTVVAKPKWL